MPASTHATPMTSLTHPLRIDAAQVINGGLIGMTLCPGKKQPIGMSGEWDRDLELDLCVIREWGAVAVVTLMEAYELAAYQVERLGELVEALGMEWHHLPIPDADVPGEPFEDQWTRVGPALRHHLKQGRRILLHCRGGLGRTGMIAARLLVELGTPPADAILAVRTARVGAIETDAQERHVLGAAPL